MVDDMVDLNNAVIWLHLNNAVKTTHTKVQGLVISWLGAGTRTLPRRGHLPRCRGLPALPLLASVTQPHVAALPAPSRLLRRIRPGL